jgi:hypothetical protein
MTYDSELPKIRVGKATRKKLEELAAKDRRKVTDYLRVILEKHAEEADAKRKKRK